MLTQDEYIILLPTETPEAVAWHGRRLHREAAVYYFGADIAIDTRSRDGAERIATLLGDATKLYVNAEHTQTQSIPAALTHFVKRYLSTGGYLRRKCRQVKLRHYVRSQLNLLGGCVGPVTKGVSRD